MKKSFRDSVLAVVRGISKGSVLSYGEVASRAGYPGSARAVGSLMKKNSDANIPCHRVIRSDGYPGEYNRGAARKLALLREEGVRIERGRIAVRA
jgi:O-6-methylguanine DNA methyltransferase